MGVCFEVEDIRRDLDMVVFKLEVPSQQPESWESERKALRRELEELRERLDRVVDALDR